MTDDKTSNDWDLMTPAQAAELLRAAPFPWWIAGGHAIEFAVGKGALRAHDDLDVLVQGEDGASAASITVADYFADADAEVEEIVLDDSHKLVGANIDLLVAYMAGQSAFDTGAAAGEGQTVQDRINALWIATPQ